jgi:hypothetical protein
MPVRRSPLPFFVHFRARSAVRARRAPGAWLCAWALFAVALTLPASRAEAIAVPGLYEGTVPGTASEQDRSQDRAPDRASLADAALRQVVVRLTGRGADASDPALAALYSAASRYVQTIRTVAGDQVVVGFDPAALDAALLRAGRPVWSRDRPLTLAVVVVERTGQPPTLADASDGEELRAIERAALLRGVPLVWPGALDAVNARERIDDVLAGRGDALLEFARRYDAAGVLYGRVSPGGARWSWVLPVGAGGVTGAVADGVDGVAERYAQAFTVGQGGAVALLPIVVTEAHGLAGFAAARSALEAVPNVRGVQLEQAAADVLTFRVNFRGDPDALRRAVASTGRLQAQEGEPGELRFALQP